MEKETLSIWNFVGGTRKESSGKSGFTNKTLFINPTYDVSRNDETSPLMPEVGHVNWWSAYFLRWKCNANLKSAVRHIYEEKLREDEREQEDEDEQALVLRGQGLHVLPPEISSLKRITEIDLRGNLLSSFTLMSLPPYVRTLRLAHNPLHFVQPQLVDAILRLEYLDTLDLSCCHLRSFPSILCLYQDTPTALLTNLKELNLRQNRLSSLPTTFCLLTKLETLDLAYNRFGSPSSSSNVAPIDKPASVAASPSPLKRSSGSIRTTSLKKIIDNPSNGANALRRSSGPHSTALEGSLFFTPRSRSSTPSSAPSSDIILSTLPVRTHHLFRLLAELPNLTSLSLAGNGLIHLSPSLLRGISSRLKKLELHDNAGLQLHHSLARLEQLEVINLNNCSSLFLLPGELFHTKMSASIQEIHARNCSLGGHAPQDEGVLLQRLRQWKKNNYGADEGDEPASSGSQLDSSTAASVTPAPLSHNEGEIYQYWHTTRLTQLRLLDLARNNLGCAPSAVFNWTRLEVLHLEVVALVSC